MWIVGLIMLQSWRVFHRYLFILAKKMAKYVVLLKKIRIMGSIEGFVV